MSKQNLVSGLRQKRKFWQAHVKAWKKSGLSQAEYSHRRGLVDAQSGTTIFHPRHWKKSSWYRGGRYAVKSTRSQSFSDPGLYRYAQINQRTFDLG